MNAETIWERNLETGVLRLYFQSPILPHLHVTVHQLPILCTLNVFLCVDKWAVLLPRLCSRWSAPPSPVLSVKLAATTIQQMQQVLLQSEEAHIACCNYYSSHVSWERVTIDTWTIWYCRINWYWLQDFDTKCEDRRHKGGACHHIHTPQLCLNTLDTHQRIKHFNPYYFGFRFMMYENISQLQTHVWA